MENKAKKLDARAIEIRKKLIKTASLNGGHLAPNLGVVELTLALHDVFDFSYDKLLFDVGHQSYVHKIITDREENFHTIRTRHGLGPFMDPKESAFDPYISGHAGTALSAGVGIALSNPNKKVVVVVGDASISNGHSLEALNNIGGNNIKNMIIILNDNDMSIGRNVGSLSKFFAKVLVSKKYIGFRDNVRSSIKKVKFHGLSNTLERMEISVKNFVMPLSILEHLGFTFFGVVDGHNSMELIKTFEKVKNMQGPIFIHIKTQKGKGYKFAELDTEKFHGISSFDIRTGKTSKKNTSYSEVFGKTLVKLAENDKNIYAISSGMVKGTGLRDFFIKFPNRSIDTGIAEGHAVSMAGGLAISGKKPYVAIYSTFIQRAYSQLIHDISLQNLNVKFIVDRAGIVGEDGKTHSGLYDMSIFLTIPNFVVIAPTCEKMLKQALIFSTKHESPMMIRIPRESSFELDNLSDFVLGKWQEVAKIGNNGKNIFIATGSMLKEILDIKDILKEKNIFGTIVSASTIKPLDTDFLLKIYKEHNIFVLEEAISGLAHSIMEFYNENCISKLIYKIGISNGCIPHGKRDELMREFGLRGESLVKRIEEKIDTKKERKSTEVY